MAAPNSKTKAVLALGLLDLARQGMRGWSAQRQAERDATHHRAARAAAARARAVVDRLDTYRHEYQPALGLPPWRQRETFGGRVARLLPMIAVVVAASAAVLATVRWVAAREPDADAEGVVQDSRVVGAVRAGGKAIDASVTKVVDGGQGVAVGAASATAAGVSAAQTAAVARAKHELDERVVAPVKRKAITFGALGILGLTVYVIVIAAIVQLVVAELG